jgi:hypothetical protein
MTIDAMLWWMGFMGTPAVLVAAAALGQWCGGK